MEVHAKIVGCVGRFIPVGSTWVEVDANMATEPYLSPFACYRTCCKWEERYRETRIWLQGLE